MSKDARFWRNVTLIALAHIAVLVGLIRWSLQTRSPSNAQSVVWIGGAENGAAETKSAAASPVKVLAAKAEQTPLKSDEPEDENPLLTAAKSEIQLPTTKPAATPTPTRKPTASPTPKAKPTPKPTPKQTPKPTPKPTPKKTVLAKIFTDSETDFGGIQSKRGTRRYERREKEDREKCSSEERTSVS